MTKWEGIEDSSTAAVPVWLSRGDKDATWKPLWKSDCQKLNALSGNEKSVHLECGRKTADLLARSIKSNFVPRCPVESLCSAIWFKRQEKNKEVILTPISEDFDTLVIETLYQKAVEATSSLGKGLSQALLDDKPLLKDNETKVRIYKTGETLSLRLVPPGSWLFTSEVSLQRGYGAYVAPGEDIELSLGPVRHVMFVVHGIGEAFFSREEVKVWGLIEQTQAARIEIQQKQAERIKDGVVSNRIEVIPVEWFSRVHDESNELMKSLRATTLTTIPALRAIANDVVFDILMYLTPAFCSQVLETVTEQICEMYRVFCEIHPDFIRNNGTFTLAGHSLGSVICWDLLAVLKERLEGSGEESTKIKSAFATGGWGPPVSISKQIPFQPDHTIFLGSPLGMFLTLRGAHPALDKMQKTGQNISSFKLPTKSLYNIFHPSDPVAYRIEPLLFPRDFDIDELPPAQYLTTPGDDVRLHIKAKQLSDVVRKTFFNPKEKGWGALIDGAVALAKTESSPGTDAKESAGKPKTISIPLGGSSPRVDFSLQPYMIDNEYISAVTAHSSYFQNSDFQNFLIGMLAGPSGVKDAAADRKKQTSADMPNLSPAFG